LNVRILMDEAVFIFNNEEFENNWFKGCQNTISIFISDNGTITIISSKIGQGPQRKNNEHKRSFEGQLLTTNHHTPRQK
jgi:hypothetical protein